VLLVLVVLLAVVAIASSGHVALGSDDTRRPSHELADTVVSLILVLVIAGGAAIIYICYLGRATILDEQRKRRAGGSRRSLDAVIAVMALLLLALFVRFAVDNPSRDGAGVRGGGSPNAQSGNGTGYEPRFATVPVAVILSAVAIAGLAAYLSYRAKRRSLQPHTVEPSLALTLADVLGEALDDLRAEPDPRVAVIAAYARLERTLSAFGVPRRESDAPGEYLRRIIVDLEVGSRHASRLTQLFEHARFSAHDVGPEMKEEAIEVLESIRADLQAAETARLAAFPPPQAAGLPA
jgi:hypothetical protein